MTDPVETVISPQSLIPLTENDKISFGEDEAAGVY